MKEKLQEIFRDVFDDETIEITREMTADDIESWDSLTYFRLIMVIEKEFHIKFTTEKVSNMKTVGEMMDYIASNSGEK